MRIDNDWCIIYIWQWAQTTLCPCTLFTSNQGLCTHSDYLHPLSPFMLTGALYTTLHTLCLLESLSCHLFIIHFMLICWSILNGFACNLHNRCYFVRWLHTTRGSNPIFWLKLYINILSNPQLVCLQPFNRYYFCKMIKTRGATLAIHVHLYPHILHAHLHHSCLIAPFNLLTPFVPSHTFHTYLCYLHQLAPFMPPCAQQTTLWNFHYLILVIYWLAYLINY